MWESSSLGVSLQASGLQYCDVREGTGEEPFKGQTIKCVSSVFVRFRGWEKGICSAEAEGATGARQGALHGQARLKRTQVR